MNKYVYKVKDIFFKLCYISTPGSNNDIHDIK